MKKIVLFLCILAMPFSFTACGSSPKKQATAEAVPTATVPAITVSTPAPATPRLPETPKEPELSPQEKAKQSILKRVDFAYTGLTTANAPMYFLSGNEGEQVALVIVNADGKRYIKFDGSADIDEDSGILTITDSDKGYMFGFTAEEQADGMFFLDCGNLGHAYLKADKPEDVVDSIITAYQTMEDSTDILMDSIAKINFMDSLDLAYSGLTSVESPMFFLASSDGTFAALVLVNSDGDEYISFVGTAAVDEDSGILTVTDSDKNYTFSFIAEVQEDGSFFLDCGNLGQCYLEPDEIENVVDYIDTVFTELDDATDRVVAELVN